jgi:hypothetical protein
VGWIALGWHDPFIPAYSVSANYARQVNVSNSRVVNVTVINNYYSTTDVTIRNSAITNIQYENVKVNGALTVVPSAALASGKPVAQVAVAVPAGAAARVSFTASASVVPTKAAVLGGHAPAAAPAKLVAPRQVASKTPPPPRPVSFEQQRPLLEKSNGVPLSPQTRSQLQKSAPAPAPRVGQPAGNQPAGKPAVANQPTGHPPEPPANANQKSTPPAANPAGNTQRPAVWTNENIGHAPDTNQAGKTQGADKDKAADKDKTAAPAHPASAPVPSKEAAPAHPAPAPAAPAHAAPPPTPQPKNPPPPPKDNKDNKDNKDKDKEKDKEPKGH